MIFMHVFQYIQGHCMHPYHALGNGVILHMHHWFAMRETTSRVANEVTGNSNWMLILTNTPTQRASDECSVNLRWKHRQEYTQLTFWPELSRFLGEKIPVGIVGLDPGTSGYVVQCFNHLATKQPQANFYIRNTQEYVKPKMMFHTHLLFIPVANDCSTPLTHTHWVLMAEISVCILQNVMHMLLYPPTLW